MRRLLLLVAATATAAALVLAGLRIFGGGDGYNVELPDAAGIRPGDDVKVAGIDVGSVQDVQARGAKVVVRIDLDHGVGLTTHTRSEVKLSSLLGQRYLELTPGDGTAIDPGATIPLAHATGAYTIERFWIESAPTLTELDLGRLSRAVDVLSTDLAVNPKSSRAALRGLTSVADLVTRRDAQIGRLLETTRAVTDEVVAQRGQLTSLMDHADQVLAMLASRRQAIDTLLAEGNTLARDLATMARTNAAPMAEALTQLRVILKVLRGHRDDLAETLRLAAPAMRLYVNSAGDGPWLGVNAPFFILPDSFWCQSRKDIGCK